MILYHWQTAKQWNFSFRGCLSKSIFLRMPPEVVHYASTSPGIAGEGRKIENGE